MNPDFLMRGEINPLLLVIINLIIAWFIGFFLYSGSGIIHILLVLAIILIAIVIIRTIDKQN